MTSDNSNESNNPPRDYNYSRLLDVHVWSDYPEVNDFINLIYDTYFSTLNGKRSIAKRHIKLVLLDLYVAWLTDPDLCLSVNMTRDFYSRNFGTGTTRYNELNISAKIITVINTLKSDDVGLIGYKRGVEAQEGYGTGFISRIWAEPKLVRMFEKSAFSEFMIYSHPDRETVLLRDKDKEDIPYEPTDEIISQRSLVKQYNELLERTFIDIGSANSPRLEIEKNKGSKDPNKPHYVRITHKGKFTYRVFNNLSWDEGGRFYGGFWQRVGQDYRNDILINDEETVELDFNSMHPVLAYAKKGVDYWKDIETDPYDLPVAQINDPDISRQVVKKLILLALNANNDGELFNAFRSEFDYSLLGGLEHKFTDDALGKILDSIKTKHSKIADQIATGAGLELMNLDSKIVEFVMSVLLTTMPLCCLSMIVL